MIPTKPITSNFSSENLIKASISNVYAKNGNIFASYDNGKTKQLTFTSKDSSPYLSSDARKIVFLRDVEAHVNSPEGDIIFNQIWMLDLDDLSEKKIFKSGYIKELECGLI